MTNYAYNFSDFTNAYNSELPLPYGINFIILENEILKSNISKTLSYINASDKNNEVDFFFEEDLTSPDQTALDSIVDNHSGEIVTPSDLGDNIGSPIDINFVFGNNTSQENYWKSNLTIWEVVRTFWFLGSDKVGTPYILSVLGFVEDSDDIGYVRIYDITNDNEIASLEINSETMSSFMSIISNVPEEGAIFQIQTKCSTKNKGVFLNSLSLLY